LENWIFITRWFFQGMRWLYESLLSATGWQISYVVVLTVLISTLSIKIITSFSDIAARKSSMKMQAIQPELDKLKKKYGNDPQRMNTEQRKLMKERGVSTMGGCLPLLIMMPIFFIFFAAFRAWSNEQTLRLLVLLDSDPDAGLEMFKQYQFLWMNNIWRPDNLSAASMMTGEQFWNMFANSSSSGSCSMCATNTNIHNFIYFNENEAVLTDLLTRLNFFQNVNGTIQIASDNTAFLASYSELTRDCVALHEGYSNGMMILPVLAAGIAFLSMWLTSKNQPQNDQNKSMKWMNYIMPLFMGYICWNQEATFALYLIFSYLFSTLLTLGINRYFKKKQQQPIVEVKK